LGGLFSGLIRRIIPAGRAFLKSKTGQELTEIGTQAASNTLSELIAGKNVKEAAEGNINDARRKIGTLIKRKIERMEESTDSDEEPLIKKKKKTTKKRRGKKYNLLE